MLSKRGHRLALLSQQKSMAAQSTTPSSGTNNASTSSNGFTSVVKTSVNLPTKRFMMVENHHRAGGHHTTESYGTPKSSSSEGLADHQQRQDVQNDHNHNPQHQAKKVKVERQPSAQHSTMDKPEAIEKSVPQTSNDADVQEQQDVFDLEVTTALFQQDDQRILKGLEVQRDAECEGKSEEYKHGFLQEWKVQIAKLRLNHEAIENGFKEQIADEKRREETARCVWEYQMERCTRQIQTLHDKLQTVKDETVECATQIARFHADPETLKNESIEELHQLMATLLYTAKAIRKVKENKLTMKADMSNCILCNESQRQLVYLPCNHFPSCKECYDRLPKKFCPICRQKIQSTLEVFT